MTKMAITLQSEQKGHDHGRTLIVDVITLTNVPYRGGRQSGFDVLRTLQGMFWRHDCYWFSSPYGWRAF